MIFFFYISVQLKKLFYLFVDIYTHIYVYIYMFIYKYIKVNIDISLTADDAKISKTLSCLNELNFPILSLT